MALDKLVDSAQLDSDLGDVADAIRAKSGGSYQLAFPLDFISEISNIQTGGGSSSDLIKTEYIVASSHEESGTDGVYAFIQTYFTQGDGVYFCTINNTSEKTPRGLEATYVKNVFTTGAKYGVFKRFSSETNTIDSNSYSFFLGAGSEIIVYFIPKAVISS